MRVWSFVNKYVAEIKIRRFRKGEEAALWDVYFTAIHQSALSRGNKSLYANVSVTARPFFEHWGFKVDAAKTVYINGVGLNNFRMTKFGQKGHGHS